MTLAPYWRSADGGIVAFAFAPQILLVRGTSGVGKSTLVAGARRLLPAGAAIDVDEVWAMLANPRWSNADAIEHPVALRASAALARSFVASGRVPVVLACSTADSDHARVLADLDGLRVHEVSLVARPDVLARRIRERLRSNPHAYADVEEAVALNEEILRAGGVQIDASDLGANDVARCVLGGL